MKTPTALLALLGCIGSVSCWSQTNVSPPLPDAASIRQALQRANHYFLAQNNPQTNGWARGVYHTGNMRAYQLLGLDEYLQASLNWATSNGWQAGIKGATNADGEVCGQTYLDLYRIHDAWTHLQSALRLARAKGELAQEQAVLYSLATTARFRRAFALSHAYLREALLRYPDDCRTQVFVHESLADLALFEFKPAEMREQFDPANPNAGRGFGRGPTPERDPNRLTANQVAFWRALHVAGTRIPVRGYGALFNHQPPAT